MSTHTTPRYLFVGERPSQRAVQIGATWQNAKLAGRTLRDVLTTLGIDPNQQLYTNLYTSATPSVDTDTFDEHQALNGIKTYLRQAYVVVGMGNIVSSRLAAAGVPHCQLVHPAARGAIRRRDRYVAHARAVRCESGVIA